MCATCRGSNLSVKPWGIESPMFGAHSWLARVRPRRAQAVALGCWRVLPKAGGCAAHQLMPDCIGDLLHGEKWLAAR